MRGFAKRDGDDRGKGKNVRQRISQEQDFATAHSARDQLVGGRLVSAEEEHNLQRLLLQRRSAQIHQLQEHELEIRLQQQRLQARRFFEEFSSPNRESLSSAAFAEQASLLQGLPVAALRSSEVGTTALPASPQFSSLLSASLQQQQRHQLFSNQGIPGASFAANSNAEGSQNSLLVQLLQQQHFRMQVEQREGRLFQIQLTNSNNGVAQRVDDIHTPLLASFLQQQQREDQRVLDVIHSQQAPSSRSAIAAAQIPQLLPFDSVKPTTGIPLSRPDDEDNLSSYQVFVRHQLEFFAADANDVETTVQGRKKKVWLGLVGIRCRHCASVPLRQRGRGSVYYPHRLSGVYQAAQNMATTHLASSCVSMPEHIRLELLKLRQLRDTAGGGKVYWADASQEAGLVENEHGLRFIDSEPAATGNDCKNGPAG